MPNLAGEMSGHHLSSPTAGTASDDRSIRLRLNGDRGRFRAAAFPPTGRPAVHSGHARDPVFDLSRRA